MSNGQCHWVHQQVSVLHQNWAAVAGWLVQAAVLAVAEGEAMTVVGLKLA